MKLLSLGDWLSVGGSSLPHHVILMTVKYFGSPAVLRMLGALKKNSFCCVIGTALGVSHALSIVTLPPTL